MKFHSICLLLAAFSPTFTALGEATDTERVVGILQEHCVKCHGGEKTKAGIDLTSFDGKLSVWRNQEIYSKVLLVVEEGEMPPLKAPPLSDTEYVDLSQWLEHTLENVDVELIPRDPGFVPPRRLTRHEYNFTVQDLFGFEAVPVSQLPPDQVIGDGFDNNANTLTMEPLWFEKSIEAAQGTVRSVWSDDAALDRLLVTRPTPPLPEDDSVYISSIEQGEICDLGDGEFTILAKFRGRAGQIFLKAPAGKGFISGSHQLVVLRDAISYRLRQGFELRAEGLRIDRNSDYCLGLTVRDGQASIFLNGELVARRANFTKPDTKNYPIKLGRLRDDDESQENLSASSLQEFQFYDHALPDSVIKEITENRSGYASPKSQFEWIPGMVSPAEKSSISAVTAASTVLANFLGLAFRRQVSSDELERYVDLFQKAMSDGATFDLALQVPVTAALASPMFLYRTEVANKTGEPYDVSSEDLANRLSFFLWASMPDEELHEAARSGRLAEPEELIMQVDRLLSDPRSTRFFERFVYQWLRTEGLGDTYRPDSDRFPEISDSLLAAMRRESVLTFENSIKENLSATKLLDAESIFVNEELASHYGLSGVHGSEWRQVSLSDPSRGGLITQAAILTVSSSPQRTSPVFRGKWVLEVLLGETPPPPPPSVPELSEDAEGKGSSVRELLELHRSQPACAGCHSRIDPYGLALEQYDAVGRIRPESQDTNTTLFTGEVLNGVEDLKNYLVEHKRADFVRHLTRQMLAYALGRDLRFADERPIQTILASMKSENAGMRTLVHEIVLSDPFRSRKNPTTDAAPPGQTEE